MKHLCNCRFLLVCATMLADVSAAHAAQTDIHGPSGSVSFGAQVIVLPNGNFVVTDPHGPVSNIGAVYLYGANGTLISTLTGSTADDQVGLNGILMVGGSNFIVESPFWNNGSATKAGAVTWVNGTTGLNGFVSTTNSLFGTHSNDNVAIAVPLNANGNYVVVTSTWNGGVGAATWGSGTAATVGAVSSSNSLIGSTASDFVGQSLLVLENGNYVVMSPQWNGGIGAATWSSGTSGMTGLVSAANSLVGSSLGDAVGTGGAFLSNGNYVIGSPQWSGGLGAATWCNGTTGMSGAVSAANSLIGSTAGDDVGNFVTALANGNYVVTSPGWNGGIVNNTLGAATWGNGTTGITGTISASNSLIGTTKGDGVGSFNSTALGNGNYVVASPTWNDGVPNAQVGAATWCNGTTGCTGPVLPGNSLHGTQTDDGGNLLVHPLTNGNYTVALASWSNTPGDHVGAVTWADGSSGISGSISSSISLIGTVSDGNLGISLTPLSNGNYVVVDALGTTIWADGAHGITGTTSAAISLFNDVASPESTFVSALSNGNYVVSSQTWNNRQGAATWANGKTGLVGMISTSNSLVGNAAGDNYGATETLTDGNYVVRSSGWNGGIGAITLASGKFRVKGTVQPWNSVIGAAAAGGQYMNYSYDATRQRLVVGRPADNIVSLFTMDQIFAGDFEQ